MFIFCSIILHWRRIFFSSSRLPRIIAANLALSYNGSINNFNQFVFNFSHQSNGRVKSFDGCTVIWWSSMIYYSHGFKHSTITWRKMPKRWVHTTIFCPRRYHSISINFAWYEWTKCEHRTFIMESVCVYVCVVADLWRNGNAKKKMIWFAAIERLPPGVCLSSYTALYTLHTHYIWNAVEQIWIIHLCVVCAMLMHFG